MKMRKLLIGGVSLALLLGACGSPDENEVSGNELNSEEVSNVNDGEGEVDNEAELNAEIEALMKETDPIADDIRKLLAVRDYDTLKSEYASPSLLKQIEDGNFKEKESIPDAVDIAGDLYELHRFNDLYDPEDKIMWYEVRVLNDFVHENLRHNPDVSEEDLKAGIDDHEEALKGDIFRITVGAKYDVYTFGLKKDEDGNFKVSEMYGVITEHDYFKNTDTDMTESERYAKSDELTRKIENKETLHEFHLKDYEDVKDYYYEEEEPSDPFGL